MSYTIHDTNNYYYYYSQLQQLSQQLQQQQQQGTDCNKSSASASASVQVPAAAVVTTKRKASIKTLHSLVATVVAVAVAIAITVAISVVDSLTFVSYNNKFITALSKKSIPIFLNPTKYNTNYKLLSISSSSISSIAIVMNPSTTGRDSKIMLATTATNVNEDSSNNKNNDTNATITIAAADGSSSTTTTTTTTTVKRVQIDQQQQEYINNDNNTNKRLKIESSYETIKHSMIDRTNGMIERYQNNVPFTNNEIQDIIDSIQSISTNKHSLNIVELTIFLQSFGHLSHKDWARTNENGNILASQLLNLQFTTNNNSSTTCSTSTTSNNESTNSTTTNATNDIRSMLKRVITDGNWDNAVQHTIQNNLQIMADGSNYFVHPWIVLVTGVNGIRKTTSIYQEWFPKLLQEAIIDSNNIRIGSTIDVLSLPVGTNSFFRQLDHIIATICNKDFTILYQYVYDLLLAYNNNDSDTIQQQSSSTTSVTSNDTSKEQQQQQLVLEKILQNDPPEEIIKLYSNLKASIFTRYRTLSELIGIYLLKEGQMNSINCMVETSGRDVAMYEYIDYLYPAHTMYKKLVLHFTINDLSYAQNSVDTRMINEIHSGIRAITTTTANSSSTILDVQRIIQTNLGGPYGSEVLPSVQHDSESVWNKIIQKQIPIPNSDYVIGHDWYKASIQINAKPIQVQQQTAVDGQEQEQQQYEPWTAQAILPDGTLGKEYTFT